MHILFHYSSIIKSQDFIVAALISLLFVSSVNALEFVGRQTCKTCHQQQDKNWSGSPHDLAMQEATEKTVLGDFSDVKFKNFDLVTTFYRQADKFMVRTDGPDGKLQDYEISYTFGVYPLQQYLVPFSDGRLQVLDIAWDSRDKSAGGQRWYHLHPEEKITADDILHWTGPNLNWNYMCADCHSTDLKKNLDVKAGGYHTRWSEMDVSCEACHGPGSEHQKWAQALADGGEYKTLNKGLSADLTERKNSHWLIDKKTGKLMRSTPNTSRNEIEVCARCHSRRSQLTDDFVPGQPFMDAYHPALLSEGLYYADGQMHDEVYVWGSFQQSRMQHAGVTCSDCHDPHSTQLREPGEKVCYQCHNAENYASRKHHFHQQDSTGSNCVECHMPATTFMGVDRRHDHGFRIPRPDLSVDIGSPNACNQCHSDKTASWSAQQVKQWYGHTPEGFQQFAPALNAAWQQQPDAYTMLFKLAIDDTQPVIARATALSQLSGVANREALMLLQQNLNADDPLLRLGALQALELYPVQQRLLAFPLVWDDIKAVRILAARLMAGYPQDQIKDEQAEVLKAALKEYIEAQEFNAERAESMVNLAGLYVDMDDFTQAEEAYRKAIKLQPQFVPAYINFAQMLKNLSREKEAANTLTAGIQQVAESASLYHALGLSQIRQKDVNSALQSLGKAATLDADNNRYQYVYAVALQSVGKVNLALEILLKTHDTHPYDTDVLYTLVTFSRDAGRRKQALLYARKLHALVPGNPDIEKLVQQLKAK